MANLDELVEKYYDLSKLAVAIQGDNPQLSYYEAYQLAIGIEKNHLFENTFFNYEREETVVSPLSELISVQDQFREEFNDQSSNLQKELQNVASSYLER
jgi:hypothetical protein